MPKRVGHKKKSPYESRRKRSADLYDAVQDTRSDRSEWNEGDVADDAAEAFRWGFTPDGREPEEVGREQ